MAKKHAPQKRAELYIIAPLRLLKAATLGYIVRAFDSGELLLPASLEVMSAFIGWLWEDIERDPAAWVGKTDEEWVRDLRKMAEQFMQEHLVMVPVKAGSPAPARAPDSDEDG